MKVKIIYLRFLLPYCVVQQRYPCSEMYRKKSVNIMKNKTEFLPSTWSYRESPAESHPTNWFSHADLRRLSPVSRLSCCAVLWIREYSCPKIIKKTLINFGAQKVNQNFNLHKSQHPNPDEAFQRYFSRRCHTWKTSFQTHSTSTFQRIHQFVDLNQLDQHL
jgi:hypothetical protein